MEYEITYNGVKKITGNLYLNVTGLKTFTVYTITVSSINNVTKAIDRKNGSRISFKTFSGRKYILFDVVYMSALKRLYSPMAGILAKIGSILS